MPRDSFAAITTLGAREYDVDLDCRRLGLHPFFPQQRKLWLPRGAQKPLLRASPLFPRYLLLPIAEARRRELHYVRGLAGDHRYLLASAEGRIWEAPGEVVSAIAAAESRGEFDEVPPSLCDKVKLKGTGALSTMEMLVACLDTTTARLFSPILGGARVTARVADLARAV
jgi:hypothetical protein